MVKQKEKIKTKSEEDSKGDADEAYEESSLVESLKIEKRGNSSSYYSSGDTSRYFYSKYHLYRNKESGDYESSELESSLNVDEETPEESEENKNIFLKAIESSKF